MDKHRLTQVGRAMKDLGVQMIAAHSPQARGRSERSFGTWQGRLPQDLRLAGITIASSAAARLGIPVCHRHVGGLLLARPADGWRPNCVQLRQSCAAGCTSR